MAEGNRQDFHQETGETLNTQRAAMRSLWGALDLPHSSLDRLEFCGGDELPSAFRVSDLAAAAIGAAALAVSELVGTMGRAPRVHVDRRRSALWFGWSIKPVGWDMPAAWDPIAGDYRTGDGWIRLHTNAPRHRAAALDVLGCKADRAAVAAAVETWAADALEAAVVAGGGCAAAMRDLEAWSAHPQGRAVEAEPLIALDHWGVNGDWNWQPQARRPLAGIKVLDLTRVLAGPVATRFLAGYGADVLRIDPPEWDEPGVIPEVTLGKRCARLDLDRSADRAIFERLLSESHILAHGYRPGALDALGYGEAKRREIAPNLVDVSLDAYGWTGPWKERRGFDSLVQMSSGIAARGMMWKRVDRPTPLPVQALDQATGYLMAATAVRGLTSRLRTGQVSRGRGSLARTAAELVRMGPAATTPVWENASGGDYAPSVEATDWGPARRTKAPALVENAPMQWERGASRLRSVAPAW
ncbi:MAG TPA: CoA transferase [Xanthobacteraceae bacterium]|nr:CoA transferase [Xanthobacteraceae bacterium]